MICNKCTYTNSKNSKAVRDGIQQGGSILKRCESCRLATENYKPPYSYSTEFIASPRNDFEGHNCAWLIPDDYPNASVVFDNDLDGGLDKDKKYKVTISIEEVE